MKFYQKEIVEKARRKKQSGFSVYRISADLGVSETTVSRWVRDLATKNAIEISTRENDAISKSEYAETTDRFSVDKSSAKILASLLYWAEGSKYPSSNFVGFANSDAQLVKTFLELLIIGFGVDKAKIRAHLQIHTNQSADETTQFWADLLGVEKSQFYKPTITRPGGSMKRRGYRGTCTIKYFNKKLLLQITGIFERFAKKIGEVA